MPPILWVFFISVGLGTGLPLLQGVTKGVDPNVKHQVSPAPQEYRVWSSAASRRPNSGCAGTSFALSTRGRVTRLRVDGQEQNLDTSWRFDVRLSQGESRTSRYEFLDPVGGGLLACRIATTECRLEGRDTRLHSSHGLCYDTLSIVEEEFDEPVLEVIAPRFVNATMRQIGQGQWQGDFDLRIVVRIRGPMNEKWWCPDVEVEWPDETRSTKGGDCDPWIGSEEQRQTRFSWTFSHRLIPGDNEIKIRLSNAGGVFAAERVRVTVR